MKNLIMTTVKNERKRENLEKDENTTNTEFGSSWFLSQEVQYHSAIAQLNNTPVPEIGWFSSKFSKWDFHVHCRRTWRLWHFFGYRAKGHNFIWKFSPMARCMFSRCCSNNSINCSAHEAKVAGERAESESLSRSEDFFFFGIYTCNCLDPTQSLQLSGPCIPLSSIQLKWGWWWCFRHVSEIYIYKHLQCGLAPVMTKLLLNLQILGLLPWFFPLFHYLHFTLFNGRVFLFLIII